MDDWNKQGRAGGQIPAFGDWEYVNELPITQYFECARQAGLIRYSSSSGECDPNNANYSADLYATHHHHRHQPRSAHSSKQGKGREKRGGAHVKEGTRKQAGNGKVFDVTVTELPPPAPAKRHPPSTINSVKKKQQIQYDAGLRSQQPRKAPKAVDEDLYKIPPELLKRKRRLGFISRCLVPPCAV